MNDKKNIFERNLEKRYNQFFNNGQEFNSLPTQNNKKVGNIFS